VSEKGPIVDKSYHADMFAILLSFYLPWWG
jgi:hypothetical protein